MHECIRVLFAFLHDILERGDFLPSLPSLCAYYTTLAYHLYIRAPFLCNREHCKLMR